MTWIVRNAWLPDQGLTDIRVEGEHIVAMGANLVAPPDAESLDAQGMAVVPGLVNGHSHAVMTLLRGFGDDMPLMAWLKTRIWPAEARLTETDIYWGTRLACLEMIRSGTLYFDDMYWNFHGMARAVEDAGLRAGLGAPLIDIEGEKQARQFQDQAERLCEESKAYSNRIHLTLTPHAIYTVSGKSLRWASHFAARHGLMVHMHLSETLQEVEQCLQAHGVRPAVYLDQQGLLHANMILAHGVHLNEEELDLIAQRGATLVTNPVSNMKLAVGGVFPYRQAAARQIPMALGTDGAASNNSLDLFQNMKIFSLLQKHAEQDPTLLPAQEAWAIASGARAPIFGQSGRVAVGEKADFILLRHTLPEMTPTHHFISNCVYAATGHIVDTAVVAGRILMHNRHVADEEEICHEVRIRTKRLSEQSLTVTS